MINISQRKLSVWFQRSLLIGFAACCIVIIFLASHQENPPAETSQVISRLLTRLETPPSPEHLHDYSRWFTDIYQQHKKLENTLNQDNSHPPSIIYHLSMASTKLISLQDKLDYAIQEDIALHAEQEITAYLKQIANIANINAQHPKTNLDNSSAIIFITTISLILIAILFQNSYPKLKKKYSKLRQTLRDQEDLNKHLSLYSDYGRVIINQTGIIQSIDYMAERIFAVAPGSTTLMPIKRLLQTPDMDTFSALKECVGKSVSSDFVGLRKLQSPFPCQLSVHPFKQTDETLFLIVIQDISTLKAAEEKTIQAQKMEALGQLTGGIAHDFNNLLLVIQGNLQLLEEDLSLEQDQEDKLELLEDALSAAADGSNLTDRLLSFSRKQALSPESCDVEQLISKFLRLLERAAGGNITISTHFSAKDHLIQVDHSQLQNVLLNLVINARDAMPNGGSIQLHTETMDLNSAHKHNELTDLPDGEYLAISVIDNGVGMSSAVKRKVFDPFFTTKETGHGTGMGLSMVYGFAQQSSGGVYLDSSPGNGTKVTLLLPILKEGKQSKPLKAKFKIAHQPRGSEHILVIEDEDRVRKFAIYCLESLGYTVSSVSNADRAHELLSQRDHGFDAIFSDMMMPGHLNGHQLAEWVNNNRPELKILMTTGFSDDIHGSDEENTYPVLHKPYTKTTLANKLRNTLDDIPFTAG